MLNPHARHEALTRLNWLAAEASEGRDHLLKLFSEGFNKLFVDAVDVAIETGDPIGQILAESVRQKHDATKAEKILAYLEREELDQALPLRELLEETTAIVLQHRLAGWPEPRSPEQQEELATLHHKLGLSRGSLGRLTEALESLEEAVRLRRSLVARGADHLRPLLAISLDGMSRTLTDLQRRERAYDASREAVALLRDAVRAEGGPFQAELARSLYNASATAIDVERHRESEALASEAVTLYRKLIEQGSHSLRGDLAKSLTNLGVAQAALGQTEQSLDTHRQAVALLEDLAAERPDRYTVDLAIAVYGLGNRLGVLERHAESLRAMERAVSLRRKLARHRPEAFRATFSRGLYNLGNRLARMGRQEDAVRLTREAVESLREPVRRQPEVYEPLLAEALNNLGNRLAQGGELAESITVMEEAISLRRRLAARAPAVHEPELAQSLSNLGTKLGTLGQHDRALEVTREAHEILQRVAEANWTYRPSLAITMVNLGRHLRDLGRTTEAIETARGAVAAWEDLTAESGAGFRENLGNAYSNLSRALREAGHFSRAIATQERAIAIYRELAERLPIFRDDLVEKLTWMGSLLTEAGHAESGLTVLEEAVRVARRQTALGDQDAQRAALADALQTSGIALYRLSRYKEALKRSTEALAILRPVADRHPIEHDAALVRTLTNHALDLARVGRTSESIDILREAIQKESALLAHASSPALAVSHGMSQRYLGEMLRVQGAVEEGLAWTQRAVVLHERLAREQEEPLYRKQLAFSLQAHCAGLSAADRDGEAVDVARRCLEILEKLRAEVTPGEGDENLDGELATAWRNLGTSLVNVGELEEGRSALETAHMLFRDLASATPAMYRPGLARTLRELAVGLCRLGAHDLARERLTEATAIARDLAAQEHSHLPELAGALKSLAVEQYHLDQYQEALEPSREALALSLQLLLNGGNANPDDVTTSLSNRVGILLAAGQEGEAFEALEHVLRSLIRSQSAADPQLRIDKDWIEALAASYGELCDRLERSPDDSLLRATAPPPQ